jgi:hypothetical protein
MLHATWRQYTDAVIVQEEVDVARVALGPVELNALYDTGLDVCELVIGEALVKVLPEARAALASLRLHDVVLGRHGASISCARWQMLTCLNEVGEI